MGVVEKISYCVDEDSSQMATRIHQLYSHEKVKALWNLKWISTIKQAGSNKNEWSHSLHESIISHEKMMTMHTWMLINSVWWVRCNSLNAKCLNKHKQCLNESEKKMLKRLNKILLKVFIIYYILYIIYFYLILNNSN